MYKQPGIEPPDPVELAEGRVYGARGILRILQHAQAELRIMDYTRLSRGEVTPGTEVMRATWQKQLEDSRMR